MGGREKGEEKSEKKKKRLKLQWKVCWVVIHQGILTVCKDRSVRLRFTRWVSYSRLSYTNTLPPQDPNPFHRIPLTSFMVFRGAEHLASAAALLTSLVSGQRIVCAKYPTSLSLSTLHPKPETE